MPWWRPTWSTAGDGLHWGVASLEQSVAGAWFKALPHPEILSTENDGRDARWCLEQLIALRPDTQAPSLTVTADNGELTVENHKISAGNDPSRVTIQLVPANASFSSQPPSRVASTDNVAAMGSNNHSNHNGGVNGGHLGASSSCPSASAMAAASALLSPPPVPTGAGPTAPAASHARNPSNGGGGEFEPPRGGRKGGGHHSRSGSDGQSSSRYFTPLAQGANDSSPQQAHQGNGGDDGVVSQCSYRNNSFSLYREQQGDNGEEEEEIAAAAAAGLTGGRNRSESGGRRMLGAPPRGINGDDGVPLLPSARDLPPTVLRVLDRTPHEKAPPEVLVYMPGFNQTTLDSVIVCGQLLCLADFPPHLKAFMFSWPGGRGLTYYTVINFSKSERIQTDFARFFASIIDAGVRDIHILCHSVGAQVLFSALHLIEPMLQTCDQQAQMRSAGVLGSSSSELNPNGRPMPKARLATCLMMSPDYPLKQFIQHDFNRLRRLCSVITLYCDRSDNALWASEIFNRCKALGKNPFALVRDESRSRPAEGRGGGGRSSRRRGSHSINAAANGVRTPHSPPDQPVDDLQPHHRGTNPTPTNDVEAPAQAGASGQRPTSMSEIVENLASTMISPLSWVASLGEYMGESVPAMFRQSSALETDLTSRLRQKGAPLDMDVIDTSWMDTNVQCCRHNYFNVNRYLIDDIRETISTKRRAHLRTGRLTHRRGNVWSFMSAPKYIVNA